MIEAVPGIFLDEELIDIQFILASGPGGQHVNKSSTAVQLRFPIHEARGIPVQVRRRMIQLAGRRVSGDGVLTLIAREHRSQSRNRQEAMDRLVDLIRRAAVKPKPRKATKPSKAAKKRRLEQKSHRGKLKSSRGKVKLDDS